MSGPRCKGEVFYTIQISQRQQISGSKINIFKQDWFLRFLFNEQVENCTRDVTNEDRS